MRYTLVFYSPEFDRCGHEIGAKAEQFPGTFATAELAFATAKFKDKGANELQYSVFDEEGNEINPFCPCPVLKVANFSEYLNDSIPY